VQKTRALVIYTIVVSFIAVSVPYALLTTQRTIHGTGTIKGVGIGVYWDLQCTDATSSLDWGILEPGSQKNYTLYLKNQGNSVLTLNMASENWNPPDATNYMILTWNCEGQQINPDEVTEFVITLSVSESVQGISAFSFDTVISGTG